MKNQPKRRKEIPHRPTREFPERKEDYPITYPPDYPGIPFPEEYPIEQQKPEIHRSEPFIDPFDEPLD